MKIAFTGYYGFSNYGDDLFASVCLRASEKYWPEHRVSLVGPQAECWDKISHASARACGTRYSDTGFMGKLSRLAAMARAAVTNDMIVLAGGSVLSSLGSRDMRRFQHVLASCGIVKLAGIGLSLGPFESSADEKTCREFLRRFEYLALRDGGSYDLAVAMGLPYEPIRACDLAGLLPLLVEERIGRREEHGPLGVAPCNYESYVGGNAEVERRRNEVLVEALGRWAGRRSVPVRIFSLNSHPIMGDDGLCDRLAGDLSQCGIEVEVVRATSGVTSVWRNISECSALVSVRLHGAISAYLAGVPFCLVEYHRKCTDFVEDVGQHPSLRLPGEVSSAAQVTAVLERLADGTPPPVVDRKVYVRESVLNFSGAPWASEPDAVEEPL